MTDLTSRDTMDLALRDEVLTPRFYTTDIAALDRIDINPVKAEWEALMREMERDPNRSHFKRDEDFPTDLGDLPEPLRRDFVDFMVTSCTSEFSGCVLYAEIARQAKNPEVVRLFKLLARDESRHAGFINSALRDYGIGMDLGYITKTKKYTYFSPKFIYYAVYLSEKIGYARYIAIYRHLQLNPEYRFHPLFKWFESWCNDEFRHGEAFALLLRAEPRLLVGLNRLWIRFFLLSVYATMYVRDHTRPALYAALGMDPTEYDYKVFRICNEITRQVFPLMLDTDNPTFRRLMEHLRMKAAAHSALKGRPGLGAALRRAWLLPQIGMIFVRLYLAPVQENALPGTVRLAPVW